MKIFEARKKLIALAISAVLSIGTVHAQVIDKATIAAAAPTGVDTVALIQKATEAARPKMDFGTAFSVETFDVNTRTVSGPGARYQPIASIPDKHEREVCEDAAQLLANDHVLSGAALLSAAELSRGDAGSETLRLLSAAAGGMMPRISDEEAAQGLYEDNRAQHDRTNVAREQLQAVRPELQLFAQLRVFGEIWGDAVAMSAGKEGLEKAGMTPAEQQLIENAALAVQPVKAPAWMTPAMGRAIEANATHRMDRAVGSELQASGTGREL